ncbi:MAG TPA: rod shape-determining protein RodA [Azonexus sp.]|nr:rod shape-determining protein RodA [Azonexus sp.]
MNQSILSITQIHSRRLLAPLDPPLIALTFLLLAYASIILISASPQRLQAHVLNLGVAITCLLVAAHTPPQRLKNIAPWLYLLGIVLLVAVALFGDVSKGARRWLNLGFTRVQPSEILKIAMPLMLAWFYHRRDGIATNRDHAIALLLLMVPVLLIARQPDLGTGILVFLSGFFVLFCAGIPWKWIAPLVGAAIALILTLLIFGDTLCQKDYAWPLLKEYQKHRVCTMLNPTSDPLGKGFHIIQSMIAVGSGGLWGKGWGMGTQTQLDFLPERHTDFIFAVLAEEFGLAGVLSLLVLYLLMIVRGLSISMGAKDRFGRYLAGSLTLGIFAYAFVNMGMVTGILPVVGVPLPFVSYGGTSLVILSISLGMLMSVARQKMLIRNAV